jgi:hypothetical protein
MFIQHVTRLIKYEYLLFTKHIQASTLNLCSIGQNHCCMQCYSSLKSRSLFNLFNAFLFANSKNTNYCVVDTILGTNW